MQHYILWFSFAFFILLPNSEVKAKNDNNEVQKLPHFNPTSKSILDSCKLDIPKLPKDLKVYGTGVYGSSKTVDFQIDDSGHETRRVDVIVNDPHHPVALILGAYEPTVWNVQRTKGTKILAIIAGGYHRQAIAGVDSSIKTLVSTQDNKGVCGYFYFSERKLEKLNPISRRLFNKPADLFFPIGYSGEVVVGEGNYDKSSLLKQTGATIDSFKLKNTPLAGQAGLDDAIKKGIIRKATAEDVKAYRDKLIEKERKNPSKDLPPIAGGDSIEKSAGMISSYNAYVVLKDFTFPAGLYGANSATFLVLEGVNPPTGNAGHSKVYDFNRLTCSGVGCGHH